MNKALSSFFILLFVISLFAQIPPTYSDVDYVGDGDEKHFLDIYIPDSLTEPAPILMWIHGGAFFSGSKGGAYRRCDLLYHNGYIIADINYRLSTDTLFPAQIYDCKAAIRFLKANAEEYMIDTTRFAVGGSSAGGHLAVFVGTTNGVDSLENLDLGNSHVSSDIHAVCDFYGSVDFLTMNGHYPDTPPDSCESYPDHESPTSPASMLLGCPILECPNRAVYANPLSYLDSSDVPHIVFHGTFDCTVPPYQSVLLDSALSEYGIDHELYLIDHAGHGSMPEFDWPIQKHRMKDFLDRVFSDESIEEINNCHSTISAYPNPFNSKLEIVFENPIKQVEIYDITGKMIFSEILNHQQNFIWEPSPNTKSGLYFIKAHLWVDSVYIFRAFYIK